MSAERTTIAVKQSTHQRLKELKPYGSMSFGELIEELADSYENEQK